MGPQPTSPELSPPHKDHGACQAPLVPMSSAEARPLDRLSAEVGEASKPAVLSHYSPPRVHSLNVTYVLCGLDMGTLRSPSEAF